MSNITNVNINRSSTLGDIISWFFSILFIAIGIINTFWGNDPGYGIFVIMLSLVFIPQATAFFKKISGISIPVWMKIVIALFIIWSAVGVGELFDKIDLMKQSFQ